MPGVGLSQHDLARRCGRDVSWVNRRLQLPSGLPDAALSAVRDGKLSSWAANRVVVPLARANAGALPIACWRPWPTHRHRQHHTRACSLPTPAAEARLLRHRRPLLGGVLGHNRVVRRQVPFRAVIFRCHAVRRPETPFLCRYIHTLLETGQMVGKY